MTTTKMSMLGVATLLFVFLCIGVSWITTTYNGVIGLQETVEEQNSVIDVQLKRRKDLILSLVDVIEEQSDFESQTLQKITEARGLANAGQVDEAQILISAVVEAYPEIQTNQSYRQLMTELSITENLITEQRKTYNDSVRRYREHSRKFPRNLALAILGYDAKDYSYLEFNEDLELPDELFE